MSNISKKKEQILKFSSVSFVKNIEDLSSKYKYCISLKAQEPVSLLKDILFNLINSKTI